MLRRTQDDGDEPRPWSVVVSPRKWSAHAFLSSSDRGRIDHSGRQPRRHGAPARRADADAQRFQSDGRGDGRAHHSIAGARPRPPRLHRLHSLLDAAVRGAGARTDGERAGRPLRAVWARGPARAGRLEGGALAVPRAFFGDPEHRPQAHTFEEARATMHWMNTYFDSLQPA